MDQHILDVHDDYIGFERIFNRTPPPAPENRVEETKQEGEDNGEASS